MFWSYLPFLSQPTPLPFPSNFVSPPSTSSPIKAKFQGQIFLTCSMQDCGHFIKGYTILENWPFLSNQVTIARCVCVCVPFRTEFSLDSYSLPFGQWWISVLRIIYCRWKHLWWGLRDALICGYKDESLGAGLILFNRRMVVSALLCLAIGSGLRNGFRLWNTS